MSYKEFDLDLNTQDDSIPESKVDKDVMYINLDPNKPKRKARIKCKLTDLEKKLFTNFLQANKDVFAWFVKDMIGIDPSVICHRLHLDPIARLVILQKRNHVNKRSKIIETEINKFKDTILIIEVHHPDWLGNAMLVHKKMENGECAWTSQI